MAPDDGTAVRQLERSVGPLTRAAVERMGKELPWFRALTAEEQSWIGTIASAGISSFVDWFRRPASLSTVTAGVFDTAPKELAGAVSLQQTVELVRTTIEVVESQIDALVDHDHAQVVREAIMRYSREIAFAAAEIYARAAEQRGAWDARLEALVVDSVLRGEADEAVRSRATALGWATTSNVCVVIGHTPAGDSAAAADAISRSAGGLDLEVLVAVQGERLVVVLGGVRNPERAARRIAGQFGEGPIVIGPVVADLLEGGVSARAAVAGFRAAPAWPEAPRPVSCDDLLPERSLSGDGHARRQLVEDVYQPLLAAGRGLLETLTAYLGSGRSTEATARDLYVHPNTVRYRLRRVTDLTGLSPLDARDAYTLRIALTLGRLRT